MKKDLNKWIWYILSIVFTAIPYIARLFGEHTDDYIYGEKGIIENLTVVLLIVAIIYCLKILLGREKIVFKGLQIWIIIFLLGSIYYAGEEMSWGQHFAGWSTPENWAEFNDQAETNLHNTSAIFDQIPRALLTIAAVVGGILIPIYRKITKHVPSSKSFYDWLLPTYVCLPVALLSVFVSLFEKVYKLFGEVPSALDIRSGETKELLLAMFMMIYVLSFWCRHKSVNATSA